MKALIPTHHTAARDFMDRLRKERRAELIIEGIAGTIIFISWIAILAITYP